MRGGDLREQVTVELVALDDAENLALDDIEHLLPDCTGHFAETLEGLSVRGDTCAEVGRAGATVRVVVATGTKAVAIAYAVAVGGAGNGGERRPMVSAVPDKSIGCGSEPDLQ